MDAQKAAALITVLLREHNRVSLPGLGSFVAEDHAPKFTNQGRLLLPPLRVIRFSLSETWNDGYLEKVYAQEIGDENLAKQEVTALARLIKDQLQSQGCFEFPGLGSMKREKKQLHFLKASNCDLHPEGFGLSPMAIKPLQTPSHIIWRSPRRMKSPGANRASRKALSRRVYLFAGIICLLLALVTCLYIFRDALSPLWERLLYSADEREWLQYLR
jgi:hypothetical protein